VHNFLFEQGKFDEWDGGSFSALRDGYFSHMRGENVKEAEELSPSG
jgi:hypothetical protein